MKKPRNNKGQAMVEYIIIVVLIAITLIVLFAKFGKGIAENVAGATSSISSDQGRDAQSAYDGIGGDGDTLRDLKSTGIGSN